MLEVGEAVYLIDAGGPVPDLLLRAGKRFDDVRAVFTTHAHGDHIDGLLPFLDLGNWYFKNTSCDIYLTEKETAEAFVHCAELVSGLPLDTERLRLYIAGPDTVYEDENISLSYAPSKHCLPKPSYSLTLKAEGKQVVFSGDLSMRLEAEDFPAAAMHEPFELLVCDMAHFGPEHIEKYLDKCSAARVCFNHVFPMDKLESISALAESGKYPFEILYACDGDVIVI